MQNWQCMNKWTGFKWESSRLAVCVHLNGQISCGTWANAQQIGTRCPLCVCKSIQSIRKVGCNRWGHGNWGGDIETGQRTGICSCKSQCIASRACLCCDKLCTGPTSVSDPEIVSPKCTCGENKSLTTSTIILQAKANLSLPNSRRSHRSPFRLNCLAKLYTATFQHRLYVQDCKVMDAAAFRSDYSISCAMLRGISPFYTRDR